MANEKDHTVLTVRLPKDLMEKARAKSDESGVPVSFVVRKAIEAWVNEGLSKNKENS